LKNIYYPNGEDNICEDAISPIILIKNRGSDNLSSLTINYEINNEGVQSYNWTGDIAFGESEEVTLSEVVYTPISTNTLDITLTSPNGNDDDDNSNNSSSVSFDKSIESSTITNLEINPGGSFGLPWEVLNSAGTVIYSGTASGSNIVNESFALNINECYSFHITSTYGNGIPGDGYFALKNSDNVEIYHGSGDSFIDEAIVPYKISSVTSINEDILPFRIYPNPVISSLFINNQTDLQLKKIEITDIAGKIIYTKDNNFNYLISINTEKYKSGIYFVNIYSDNNIITKKISVVK
jgi:hypothetical protein